eukprot:TRINITY_DN1636_c0_g1_i1.p1 TRINITY_DN1636_c0_g1~~TRINITY_DN1636_c0_g1_i1.p1  ORF type:complete len:181 (-),score=25.30 TRINITY_DN1636_c0_g1_i1:105-647(-)
MNFIITLTYRVYAFFLLLNSVIHLLPELFVPILSLPPFYNDVSRAATYPRSFVYLLGAYELFGFILFFESPSFPESAKRTVSRAAVFAVSLELISPLLPTLRSLRGHHWVYDLFWYVSLISFGVFLFHGFVGFSTQSKQIQSIDHKNRTDSPSRTTVVKDGKKKEKTSQPQQQQQKKKVQ